MITIKDVAKKAGVSTATVSRVINKRESLSKKTLEKVTLAMEELNYQPNTVARSLVKGKHYSIGVILPSLMMPFWAQIANELEKSAAKNGYSIMIMSAEDVDFENKYEELRGRMSDGIITSYFNGSIDYINKSSIPTVIIGNADYDHCVSSNDKQGGLLAARHLIARGCKNIIHIGGKLEVRRSSNERSYTFIEECEKKGIPCKVYQATTKQLKEMDFSALVNTIFYENENFDGIFASNDILAANCISVAISLGYRIPEDIKIVGYDDINISKLISPSLTTIHQDYCQLAENAVSTLLRLIAGEEVPNKQIIPVELVERKTT